MTVSSEVDICNLSLDLLNVKPISSIDTPSGATAELCARWYDQTRRQALRRHPWNFAAKRVVLAPNATPPEFGWLNAFDLPSDFIRMMHINEFAIERDNPVPTSLFTIENDQILIGSLLNGSNSNELRLVYVSNFTTVTKMDPSFIDYFSALLAKNMAYKITQSNSALQRIDAVMDKAATEAKTLNGQDNPPKRIERSRNRAIRRSGARATNLDGTIVFT